jgi:hypothetical protein
MEKLDSQESCSTQADSTNLLNKSSAVHRGDEKPRVLDFNDPSEDDGSSYIIIENTDGDDIIQECSKDSNSGHILYQCHLCAGLIEPEHILNHLQTHKVENLFHCETCGVAFPSKERFENHSHEKSEDKRSDSLKCEMCHRSFDSLGELSEHYKTRTHVNKLEELAVVPKGTFSNIERNIASLSASDHDEFIELLKNKIANHLEASSPVEMIEEGKKVTTERSQSSEHFQSQSQYEKIWTSSSERVTVERKQENNEDCLITAANVDYPSERGVSPNMPHLCEICRRGFINLEHLQVRLKNAAS